MPIEVTGPASRSPSSALPYSPRMSQCSLPDVRTGRLGKRRTSVRASLPAPTDAVITRPLEAPRSMAAKEVTAPPGRDEERGERGDRRDEEGPGAEGAVTRRAGGAAMKRSSWDEQNLEDT